MSWMLLAWMALAGPVGEEVAPDELPLQAVVLVVQGPATCAGAFVDEQGTVATAYHCITNGGRPRITTHDGRSAVGRVRRIDVSMDLALVAVPELAGEPHLPVRQEPPPLGGTVRAIGHPFGAREPQGFVEGTLRWAVSQGVVSAVGPRSLQVTAPVNPGNSGGPLIDAEGRLVGVVSRRYSGDGMGFGARADGVAALLEGEGRGFSPLGGTLGLEVYSSLWEATGGGVTVGARLEVAFRDRVVLGAGAAVPLAARWAVARFGEPVRWAQSEARLGLRQRFFRGAWASWIEAWGGGMVIQSLVPDDRIVYRAESEIAPAVGGSITVGGSTVDLGFVRTVDGWAVCTLIAIRWPGTFWMF